MSRQVTLIRPPKGTPDDDGTFGKFIVDLEGVRFTRVSGELPWRDNKDEISCVPVGTYHVKLDYSPKRGTKLYELQNVPGRTDCQFHSASYCGDVLKGKRSDLLGCISLGERTAVTDGGQKILTGSRKAIKAFYDLMKGEDFILTIMEAQDER